MSYLFKNKLGYQQKIIYLCTQPKNNNMEINRNLFDLEDIYVNVNQAITLSLCEGLRKAKDIFIERRKSLVETDEILNQQEIADIDEQLAIINTNIKTLENVLIIHESKQFIRREVLNESTLFCMN